MMPLYDAHNHLQDDRLAAVRGELLEQLPATGLKAAVVNGSAEDDWDAVADLARMHSWITPSFGLHPWYVKERSPGWKGRLATLLTEFPSAAVGEIGLDRWIENPDIEAQVEAFKYQLELAAARGRAASVHCLRAWGLLEETLAEARLPERGFLLHSYGGPVEMVETFVRRGAYFSLSPYFCHERKARQAEVFKRVPLERLLAESDAPDMWPPDSLNAHPLQDSEGKPLNHPANLRVSYEFLAALRGMEVVELAAQLEQNFLRLFG